MPTAIYVLCALTSILAAVLLTRGYRRFRTRLLLWSSIFFVCQAITNVLLVMDLAMFPTGPDLVVWRNGAALAGVVALLYGLIWEAV